jgi:hypothetical protein
MKQYTYFGSADDVVKRYPWKQGWNINSINNQLMHAIIYDQKLVMNDGYLVANSEFLESLGNLNQSLLGNAFLTGNVVLFSRSQSQKLVEGLYRSAEKQQTHRVALESKNGKNLTDGLEILEKEIENDVIRWPADKNMGAIFSSLLESLNNNNALDLALPSDSLKSDFQLIYKKYSNDMDSNFNEARQHWERLCWQIFGNINIKNMDLFGVELKMKQSYDKVKVFMQIANEAYHVAYCSALHWSVAKDMNPTHEFETRPMTAFCPAYLDLFKTEKVEGNNEIQLQRLGELLISVNPLKFKKSSSDYSWIRSIALNNNLVSVRKEYLSALDKYMHWDISFGEAQILANSYKSELASLIANKVSTISGVVEFAYNHFGGIQVISTIKAIGELLHLSGMVEPINTDVIGGVKRIFEGPEIERKLSKQGIQSQKYGANATLARELGLINAALDPNKVSSLLSPIKPFDPSVNKTR